MAEKRLKTEEVTENSPPLTDLPFEIIVEIVKYDTTTMASLACKILYSASLYNPHTIKVDTLREEWPTYLDKYPHSAHPYNLEFGAIIEQDLLEWLAKQKHSPENPRFSHVARLRLDHTMVFMPNIIRSIVDVKSVERVGCYGTYTKILDILSVPDSKLRSLSLTFCPDVPHPILKIPTKIEIRDLSAGRIVVMDDTFNPKLRTLYALEILVAIPLGHNQVIYTPLHASQQARALFGKWYPHIHKIRTHHITDTWEDDITPVTRAMIRGSGIIPPDCKLIPDWILEESKEKGGLGAMWIDAIMQSKTSLPSDINIKTSAIMAKKNPLLTNRRWSNLKITGLLMRMCIPPYHEPCAIGNMLMRATVPPTPRYSMTEWTNRRLSILSATTERMPALNILSHMLHTDLVAFKTALYIAKYTERTLQCLNTKHLLLRFNNIDDLNFAIEAMILIPHAAFTKDELFELGILRNTPKHIENGAIQWRPRPVTPWADIVRAYYKDKRP